MANNLDQLCINTIRFLSADAVQQAHSGHPGMPMGMADTAYVLWTQFLKHNPKNPAWVDRDRFILSKGHACPAWYSAGERTSSTVAFGSSFRRWTSAIGEICRNAWFILPPTGHVTCVSLLRVEYKDLLIYEQFECIVSIVREIRIIRSV